MSSVNYQKFVYTKVFQEIERMEHNFSVTYDIKFHYSMHHFIVFLLKSYNALRTLYSSHLIPKLPQLLRSSTYVPRHSNRMQVY